MKLMLYSKVSLLNKSVHKDLSIEPTDDFIFAKNTNSIALLAVEFRKAAREYPIIFVKNGEDFVSAALLGLRENENLFVQNGSDKSIWDANYIPAYIRRYPFVPVSRGTKKQLTIGIDEKYSGFNYDSKGERLFTENGEPGERLEQTMAFLHEYQEQHLKTVSFCKKVYDLGLLEPMTANAELNNGEKFGLTGFHSINRERLASLEPDTLGELIKSGEFDLIYAHLFSMDNFERLMARM